MGLWIELYESSYSIENNSSVVSYYVYMSSNGSSWNKTGSARLHGGTFGTIYVGFSTSEKAQLLHSGSTTVYHNSDGTGSWSASTYYYTDTTYYGDTYASASITLTTIPRASDMTAPSSAITGTASTITISPKSSAFSHKLYVYYKNASGSWESSPSSTMTVSAGKTSVSYTPAASLFKSSDFASTASRSGKFVLQTYNGSTAIGNAVTKEFTLTLQQDCKPQTPTITYAPLGVYEPVSGGEVYYLKGKSNITLNANSTLIIPSGETVSGSIYKYVIDIGGQHLTPTPSSALTNYTLPNPIDRSGSVTLNVTAYDTRGRSATYSGTVFTVYDYSEPSSSLNFTQNGTNVDLNMSGKYYNFSAETYDTTKTYNKGDFAIYNGQYYTCTADGVTGTWDTSKWRLYTNFIDHNATILQYQIQGATAWTTIDPTLITFTYGTDGTFTASASFTGDTHDDIYIIQLFLRDDIGYPITYTTPTVQIVTGKTPISFLKGGDGVTFGAEASTSGVVLSSGWDIKIEDADLQTSLVSVLGKEIIANWTHPALCFTANEANSTISIRGGDGKSNFQYRTDMDDTWNTFVVGTTTITLANNGDKVWFKGNNPNGINNYRSYYNFVMTGGISASGNIMSLIDDGACTTMVVPLGNEGGCFYQLFNGCTSLTTAPELPATTLANACYQSMFYGCTSLTTPPKLPATTLAEDCYGLMFYGCTSLYVSDSSGSGYSKAWRIPTSGTFTNTNFQGSMFTNCKGTRSSDDMAGASGSAYTYYTQNELV